MANLPSIEQRGRDFVVRPIRPEDIELISSVPGLRLVGDEARGTVDAIAAACHRLKIKPNKMLAEAQNPLIKVPPVGSESPVLYHYQEIGVQWILDRLQRFGGALLADEMGLGKTRQAVVVCQTLGGVTLIICPASVRESWRAELLRMGVSPKDMAILGPPSDKAYAEDWGRAATATWVVSSYDTDVLDKMCQEAFLDRFPSNVVLDEGHLVRGRSSARSALVDNICGMADHRLALTGSPAWDRPRDFFRIFNIILPRSFGSARAFDYAYCGAKEGEHGGTDNRYGSNTDELKIRLSYFMLRREKREVAEQLPQVSRQIVWLPTDKNANALYLKAMASTTNSMFYTALRASLEAKIPAAVDLACTARRFLLFTYETAHAAELAKKINGNGVKCYTITGAVSTIKRQQIINEAAARGFGIVATIDSCGTGVDGLQKVADQGIFHSLEIQPNKHLQAEARLDRIGQTNPVSWTYLAMKESMDEPVVRTMVQKLDYMYQTMGGKRDVRNTLDANIGGGGLSEDDLIAQLRALADDEDAGDGD